MDGKNNGKPYEQMDDFGGAIIFGLTPKSRNKQNKSIEHLKQHNQITNITTD